MKIEDIPLDFRMLCSYVKRNLSPETTVYFGEFFNAIFANNPSFIYNEMQ